MITLILKIVKYLLFIVIPIAIVITGLELFSSYTVAATINTAAPVQTRKTITINAPAEKVWQVFADVNHWPAWNPEVTKATLTAPFQAGSVIEWESAGFPIRSELQTVEPYTTIGWAGEAFGSFAIHVWHLDEHNGQTTVVVEESMEGWMVLLMQRYLQPELHAATERWLRALKQEAER